MTDELVDIVDGKGNVIDCALRRDVYKTGLLHLTANILLFNSRSDLYLQQRSATKEIMPLFWDISASEHVKSGESTREAAIRGLREELGVDVDIKLLRPFHKQRNEYLKDNQLIIENELVELYVAVYNGKVRIDKNEVARGKFIGFGGLDEVTRLSFTPWGLDEVNFILKNPKIIERLVHQI